MAFVNISWNICVDTLAINHIILPVSIICLFIFKLNFAMSILFIICPISYIYRSIAWIQCALSLFLYLPNEFTAISVSNNLIFLLIWSLYLKTMCRIISWAPCYTHAFRLKLLFCIITDSESSLRIYWGSCV